MRLTFTIVALLALTSFEGAAPAMAQPTTVCGYGQACPNGQPVPFPVINPAQGLSNVLTYPLRLNQPPPPPPAWAYAPIATPPPVMPPVGAP
jgi:hypothetical protein